MGFIGSKLNEIQLYFDNKQGRKEIYENLAVLIKQENIFLNQKSIHITEKDLHLEFFNRYDLMNFTEFILEFTNNIKIKYL